MSEHFSGYLRTETIKPTSDPVAKAVDDYLLMERKARAWDELRRRLFPSEARVLAEMDRLVHPAPASSTS